jgi:hypothetical protein
VRQIVLIYISMEQTPGILKHCYGPAQWDIL